MGVSWSQAPDKGLPAPDVVLYLDLPLEVAEQRGGFGQERYEKREMQQQVHSRTQAAAVHALNSPSLHVDLQALLATTMSMRVIMTSVTCEPQVQRQFERLKDETWRMIDAAREADDVAADIRAAVGPALDTAAAGQPLRTLWGSD